MSVSEKKKVLSDAEKRRQKKLREIKVITVDAERRFAQYQKKGGKIGTR